MRPEPHSVPRQPSRRWVVRAVAIAGVGGGVLAGVASANPAKMKLAPGDIGYQTHPSGAQRCDACANWRPPAGCELVAGTISPSGWCGLFKARA